MRNKLITIFNFLKSNRQYNKRLHERFYESTISSHSTTRDRVISLLYHISNTQSQPKIDKLANTYKSLINDNKCLNSFEDFITKINQKRPKSINFNSLFNGMKQQEGWGNKTSALFVKSIYHLHNNQYPEHLKIWTDVPKTIQENDEFHLPVDSVITEVFYKIDSKKTWNFELINKTLKSENFHGLDIEIWDDLWFWGFITQYGSGKNREFKWNENKYWIIKESDKSPRMINEIKIKAEEFISFF
jgi:hypothetical protein